MNTVLRFLGVLLVARTAARLPGPWARLATAVVLVLVNLLPIWAVATERAGMGDVFLVYWLENVVVWLCGIVRVATAETTRDGEPPDPELTKFFAIHYGTFTLVHGALAAWLVWEVGLESSWVGIFLVAALIAASHLFSLGVNWFGRGERKVVTQAAATFSPYPRMLVMQVGLIVGFALIGGPDGASDSAQVTAVAWLCGMKTVVDLVFHVRDRWKRQVDRTGFYGAPMP